MQAWGNKKYCFEINLIFVSLTCFYLHGNPGSGKTLLMDLISKVILPKKLMRIHFHEFMIKTHNSLHELRAKNYSKDDLISSYAKMIQLETDVIFFDEFQVTNIVDAMILGNLFKKIFEKNIKVIFSSNIKINDLYKDGLQRDQFIPFIKISGINTATRTTVVAIIAKDTCLAPL